MTKVYHYKLPSTDVSISNIVVSERSLQQSAIQLAKLALNSKQIQFEIYNISLEKLIELINIQFIILRPLKDTLVVSGYNQSKNTIQFKTVPKSFIILQGINPINEIEEVLKNQNQYSFSIQFQTQNAVRSDNIADQILKILQISGTLAQIQVNNVNQNIITVEIQNIQQKIILNKNAHRYHKIFISNQKVFDQIIAAACKLENKVQIDLKEEFTDTQFQAIHKIIQLDYPELFFIKHMTYTSWNDYINEIVIFTDNPIEIESKNKELTEEIQKLETKIRIQNINTPEQIILFEKRFIDYLQDTEYLESTTAHDAYGCIVLKKCVCQGYSAAFQLLCDRIGLRTISIFGIGAPKGQKVPHMWNMIKIKDNFYHVDITWCAIKGNFMKWLNVDDEYCYQTHSEKTYFTLPVCSSLAHNYYNYYNKYISKEGQFENAVLNLSNGYHQFFFTNNIQPLSKYFGAEIYNDFLYSLQFSTKRTIKLTQINCDEEVASFNIEFLENLKTEINLQEPGKYLIKMGVDELVKLMGTTSYKYNYLIFGQFLEVTFK
ncbi:Transglutaminase-like_superfamily protein [Hexamita inflata]|uniref:Transglutaminase-like superfamily protein n=1 Tax=Hexamita inflata TaxID=28002 RepID=A0AA86RAM9_9EUKA|nr:Transglutaminase-like superfamily protein [Hexamita inflata]